MSNILIGAVIAIAGAVFSYYKSMKIRPDTQFLIDDIKARYWLCRFGDSNFYTPNGECIWIFMGSCKPHNGTNVWNFKEKRAIREAIKEAHRKKINDPKGVRRFTHGPT